MNIKNKYEKIIDMVMLKLSSPTICLALYCSTALFFATVYTIIGDNFYQTSITFEPAFKRLEISATQQLGEDLKNINSSQSSKNDHKIIDVAVQNMEITTSADSILVNFQVQGVMLMKVGPDVLHLFPRAQVSARLQRNPIEMKLDTEELGLPHIPVLAIQNVDYNRGEGNPLQGLWPDDISMGRQVRIAPSTWKAIQSISLAKGGMPADIPAKFERMLYFSVVTLSTVGYGDIVPLTPFARFLVGIEATLGVIFIGLCINGLYSAINKRRASDSNSTRANAYLANNVQLNQRLKSEQMYEENMLGNSWRSVKWTFEYKVNKSEQ